MDDFASGLGGEGSGGAWSQEAMSSGAGVATGSVSGDGGGAEPPTVDAAFKLQVEEGATVSATFPFFGDPEGGQLSFQIGDHIEVLQKDELWSWGKLEKTGEEGWFPHNYVQASFQPLPGMHELKQRILIKKAREEAIARGDDPDLAEQMVLNGGVAPQQQQAAAPELAPEAPRSTGLESGAGLNLSTQDWDWESLGTRMMPSSAPLTMDPPKPDGGNNGLAWGTAPMEADPDFGMWMDDLGENQSSVDQDDNESVASTTSSDRERRRRERKNIARELLDTEDKYVKMLEALLATIIRPCLGQGTNKSSPLPKHDANELFGTLRAEEILAINTAFREQLRGRMATLSDETCFGDLFKRFAPFLKMYVEYCTQHENTASRVSLIAAKSDKFSNLLHRARSDPRCQDLDAQSLLIMPIQRIPRYKLLLEGMLKNTEKDHADRPLLQTAIEQISDVASFINDSIKRRENQAKIWDLQAMLSEPIDLAKPTRIFIRSGVLTKLGRRYQDREDFFALFNDGLLHAKPTTFGNKYVFKRIDAVLQVEHVGFLKDKPKALHVFRVVTKGHIYLLSCKSASLKQDWMKVLELAIRGGKRECIHKGPLRVLQVGKESGIRLEYFYVFNDVVVRGKALWRGKFKHKETLDVTRVDPCSLLDARHEALLPKEVTQQMAHEQTFRIYHRDGVLIVMAKSDTDKALWLSSLEHQRELKRNAHIGTVSTSKRIVHEDNFADLEKESQLSSVGGRGDSESQGSGRKTPHLWTNSSGSTSSRALSPGAEQRRRMSAAATLGTGSVNGGGGDHRDYRGSSRGQGAPGSGGGRDRRRQTDGSPNPRSAGPLTTTSDLLVSLDSSDEDEPSARSGSAVAVASRRPTASYGRQPQQQQQQQRQQMSEGYTPSSGGGGRGSGGAMSSALVPVNANSGGGGGQSLLDKDLMAVFGAPAPAASSAGGGYQPPQSHNNQLIQQQRNDNSQGFPTSSSFSSLQGAAFANSNNNDNSASRLGGSGPMLRHTSAPGASVASSGMPLLQPPTRDTPPFRTMTRKNGAGGVSPPAPGAMVVHGQAGAQQLQQPSGGRALVLHGGGQGVGGPGAAAQGNGGGFGQFQGQTQGHFAQPQQQEVFMGGGAGGRGFGGSGTMEQGFSGIGQPQQQAGFSGRGMQPPQQQFQQSQMGFSQQFAPPLQQQQQQQYQQQRMQQPQQQFQQGRQMQQPLYEVQQPGVYQQNSQAPGQFQGF